MADFVLSAICPQVCFSNLVMTVEIALMRDDVTISLVTSKRGLVVMLSREY